MIEVERLRKLSKRIGELLPEQFDINTWVAEYNQHNCGTVCCVAGWCPSFFPDDWKWRPTFGGDELVPCLKSGITDPQDAFQEFFGLSPEQTRFIIYSGRYRNPKNVTREDVQHQIETVLYLAGQEGV